MKGPISTIKKSKGFPGMQEPSRDRIAQQDEAEAKEKRAVPVRAPDKISSLLEDPQFITDYTWPFLFTQGPRGQHRQLFVSRWYFRKSVAMDLFTREEPDPAEVIMKRRIIEEHGFKYFAMSPSTSLADLAAYLGA